MELFNKHLKQVNEETTLKSYKLIAVPTLLYRCKFGQYKRNMKETGQQREFFRLVVGYSSYD
jgi:hypothetical protein